MRSATEVRSSSRRTSSLCRSSTSASRIFGYRPLAAAELGCELLRIGVPGQ